jgi:hypothetical protein
MICKQCQKDKYLDKSNFAQLPSGNYDSKCKECRKQNHREWYWRNRDKELIKLKERQDSKREFYRQINRESYRRNKDKEYNKKRVKEYGKNYYLINKDKIKDRVKVWVENNKESVRQRLKIYRIEYDKNNADRISQRKKRYRENNREIINKRRRDWHYKNPGKVRVIKQRRRNRVKQVYCNYNVTLWEACVKYFSGCCAYCGKQTLQLTQDHFVPLSKGGEYTRNNIIPACKSCNGSKSDRDFFVWYAKQKFYSLNREKKILSYLNILIRKSA